MMREELEQLNYLVKNNPAGGRKVKKGSLEYDLRNKKIVTLYLQHRTYNEICKELDITLPTVRHVIANLIKEWQKDDIKKLQEYRWKELQKINIIEEEMWEAWHASKKQPKKTVMNAVSGRVLRDGAGNLLSGDIVPTSKRVETTEEQRFTGDMSIMETIKWCSKSRRELLGLDMPKKFVETADIEGTKSKIEFTRDEILDRLDKWTESTKLEAESSKEFIDAEVIEIPESHRLTASEVA